MNISHTGVTMKTVVVCHLTAGCGSGGIENETLESCCTQGPSVFNYYYDIPESILSRCQPCPTGELFQLHAFFSIAQMNSLELIK